MSKLFCPVCKDEVRVNRQREYNGEEFADKQYIVTCNTCGITSIGLDDKVLKLYEKYTLKEVLADVAYQPTLWDADYKHIEIKVGRTGE